MNNNKQNSSLPIPPERSTWGKIGFESLGLGLAEGVSIATSLGVAIVADDIAPKLIKNVSKTIAKACEPYLLDPAEWVLTKVCRLKECEPDYTKSREERAETLAHTGVVFTAAFITSMAAKLVTRKIVNDTFRIYPPHPPTGKPVKDFVNKYLRPNNAEWNVFYWDEGVHYGSLLFMNSLGAKYNDNMIQGASSILQKTLGWSKEHADRAASMGIIWEIPNALGMSAGFGSIIHHHLSQKGKS